MIDATKSLGHHSALTANAASTAQTMQSDSFAAHLQRAAEKQDSAQPDEVREAFDKFVGQTLFGQMLSSMRKTVDKPAYFHGGQAEEMFRGQLDQILAERMTEASSGQMSQSLYQQFSLTI